MRTSARRAGVWVGLTLLAGALTGCGANRYQQVSCAVSRQSIFVLEAQAVPSATYVPCVFPLPAGWKYAGSEVRSGFVRFWLDSDRAGKRAAEITLSKSCDVSAAAPLPRSPSLPAVRSYEKTAGQPPASTSYHVFAGGCVTSRLAFSRRAAPTLFAEVDRALGFTPRSLYVDGIRTSLGLTLCGAGAPPCPG